MLQLNKLLSIFFLAQFLIACDSITPDPLVSSPDTTLELSVLVPAQVATSETVTYTLPIVDNTTGIYEINVRNAGDTNPDVLVCETENCDPIAAVGVKFPNDDLAYDGTIIWYSATAATTLYIYVGGGDETQYSITASLTETSTGGGVLSSVDSYGVVYSGEDADYTYPATVDLYYQVEATVDNDNEGGTIELSACTEPDPDCLTGTQIPFSSADKINFDSTFQAPETGTLYIFAHGLSNSLFHIKVTEVPAP